MKKKMSNKKFLAIMIPILAVCTALVIAANVVAGYFAQSLDTYLGKGERVVVKLEGTEKWDTDYYQKACPQALGDDGSLMAAARVAKKITDEGIVLLKNKDNTLPLAKNADVVPFGYQCH